METDIHRALAQLEDNLSKLNAAREQVDNLAKGGQALTDKTVALLESAGQLLEVVRTDTQQVLQNIVAGLEAMERQVGQAFTETTERMEKSVSEVSASAEETLARTTREQTERLNDFRAAVEDKLAQGVSDFQDKLAQFESRMQEVAQDTHTGIDNKMEAFAVAAQDLVRTSRESVQQIAVISEKALSAQVEKAEALLLQLKETDAGVRGLLSHFRELDLAAKWSAVATELKDFRAETEARLAAADARMEALRKDQTYLFYALGGIALLLLVLKFV